MGAQLVGFFDKVGKEFGVKGRMKLALLTSITSRVASTEQDSPDNIRKFERAIEQIREGGAE